MSTSTSSVPPLAEGIRPVPQDEYSDTGTLLCPTLPADLVYVDDSRPGIRRRLLRGKFAYFDEHNQRIRDEETIKRINKLVIPPAYTDVWICNDPKGHLQATGRDAKGRKQYRYHERWREIRDANKYERLLEFGRTLPKLRAKIEADLNKRDLGRAKVMATVVSLLDSTLIRVGNMQYARDNKSFGLTTLRNRHVEVKGQAIRFHFRGKSGVEHNVSLKHPRLARIIKRCMDLPGQHLFQYLDDEGVRHTINSSDVNLYLQEQSGSDFTAKDYRTWAGSALALASLRELPWKDEADAKKQVVAIIKEVSNQLGNTPAVCRKCYIHPAVLDAYLNGDLSNVRKARARKGLRPEEVALITFLEGLNAEQTS
ncbi:DNA topoisomerase IB [Pseudomonas sp. RIT-PI-AD]|uniref:DNA topoisomerase IB n=1 Tax=Pseudomonas sp. RIT-PI-AD TaxID=3035294 RepID=UPI0021DA7391|nr:DNA topoisomerase IB [Pseudomonas sp. RIT-PI-AD]